MSHPQRDESTRVTQACRKLEAELRAEADVRYLTKEEIAREYPPEKVEALLKAARPRRTFVWEAAQ